MYVYSEGTTGPIPPEEREVPKSRKKSWAADVAPTAREATANNEMGRLDDLFIDYAGVVVGASICEVFITDAILIRRVRDVLGTKLMPRNHRFADFGVSFAITQRKP